MTSFFPCMQLQCCSESGETFSPRIHTQGLIYGRFAREKRKVHKHHSTRKIHTKLICKARTACVHKTGEIVHAVHCVFFHKYADMDVSDRTCKILERENANALLSMHYVM